MTVARQKEGNLDHRRILILIYVDDFRPIVNMYELTYGKLQSLQYGIEGSGKLIIGRNIWHTKHIVMCYVVK